MLLLPVKGCWQIRLGAEPEEHPLLTSQRELLAPALSSHMLSLPLLAEQQQLHRQRNRAS